MNTTNRKDTHGCDKSFAPLVALTRDSLLCRWGFAPSVAMLTSLLISLALRMAASAYHRTITPSKRSIHWYDVSSQARPVPSSLAGLIFERIDLCR